MRTLVGCPTVTLDPLIRAAVLCGDSRMVNRAPPENLTDPVTAWAVLVRATGRRLCHQLQTALEPRETRLGNEACAVISSDGLRDFTQVIVELMITAGQ